MTIAVISHPDCVLHNAGAAHPECPERFLVIQEALKQYPFKDPLKFFEAPLATKDDLIRAHRPKYVDWIFSIAPKHATIAIDQDTKMNPFSLQAALRAAGAVILAVDLVMQGEAKTVFCNVRPPGHHAEQENAMGFCLFNNVAVGVEYALQKYHLKHIAIIDFDAHHGNGTQNIFQHNKHVMYCSSFQHPFYPGYDEERDNQHIIGVPLAAGTSGEEFREKVRSAWFEKLNAFKPELIFFSAGFDAHANDPLTDLKLTKDDYVWITQQIKMIAEKYCAGKMISVLEGGYDLTSLADCVPAHVAAMSSF